MNTHRRDFLKESLTYGSVFLTNSAFASFGNPLKFSNPLFFPDVEIEITAKLDQVQLLNGEPTQIWKYAAQLIKGSSDNLQVASQASAIGPTLSLNKGQKVRIRFKNELPEPSIIHWHGIIAPESSDGHPSYAVGQGSSYTYEFEVINRAGTYWYHPHPHGRTGKQVYNGLSGFFIVHDEEEQAAQLPIREHDQAFVIQDRLFDKSNQLVYVRSMHDRMMGMFGDKLLVNGQLNHLAKATRCPQRVRLLNGSNARIYKLAWEDGSPVTVIGNDGGLLQNSITEPHVFLAPAERREIWVDFSDAKIGDHRKLVMLDFRDPSKKHTVLDFEIVKGKTTHYPYPTQLSKIALLDPHSAVNFDAPKVFELLVVQGKGWTINGESYQMKTASPLETVFLGDTEIWEFTNKLGMPHPIHIHGSPFQVLSRSSSSMAGIIDQGWKDTVLVMGGETVRIIKKFDHHRGYFLYHCHNLEHEDMGMMREYRVV